VAFGDTTAGKLLILPVSKIRQ